MTMVCGLRMNRFDNGLNCFESLSFKRGIFYNNKEHGRFPTYKENAKLRQWALKIEKGEGWRYRRKLEKLKAIGYEVRDRWQLWDENYKEAKRIFEETGTIPTYKNGREARRYFDTWITNSGKLHPERMAMLTDIGFNISTEDKVWADNYTAAYVHYEKTGHFPTSQENVRLYMWARGWMIRYADQYPAQAEKLRQIGFNG